jgi:hypothetical protein
MSIREDLLTRVRIRIEFCDVATEPRVYERETELQEAGTLEGEQYLADYLALELGKEVRCGEHHRNLPQVEGIGKFSKQTFAAGDLFSGDYFNRINSRWVWFEIGNTLLEIKHLLSHARAYKQLETPHNEDLRENSLLYNTHFVKMEKFTLAVFLLRKVEDLFLRLVFENLGPALAPDVDITQEGWERNVTWKSIKAGIRQGRQNPTLLSLTDQELEDIRKIMNEFGSPQYAQDVVAYRNRLTHGLMPSVDYRELYTFLENRVGEQIIDATGKKVGTSWGIGGRPTNAEYAFLTLYDCVVKTLQHYVAMLGRLRAIPRFVP